MAKQISLLPVLAKGRLLKRKRRLYGQKIWPFARACSGFFLFQFFSLVGMSVLATPLPSYEITIGDGSFKSEKIEMVAGQRFKISIRNIRTSPVEFKHLSIRVKKVLEAGVQSFVVIHPLKVRSHSLLMNFILKCHL